MKTILLPSHWILLVLLLVSSVSCYTASLTSIDTEDGEDADTGDREDGDAGDEFEILGDPGFDMQDDWYTRPDEPFPEPDPVDQWEPWVPELWDAPFDYMDIPPDYQPDPAACGNGVVDSGEECDDGNTNDQDSCTNRCLLPRCGDGSVWSSWEDCDPPGAVRPCATRCDAVGGEWCDIFCRWTGYCVPFEETCGNGIDDDCDGVTDRFVRRVSEVTIASTPGPRNLVAEDIAWTGSEFAVVWKDLAGGMFITRLDSWGMKTDWDIGVPPRDNSSGFYWTGGGFGYFFNAGSMQFFQALSPSADPVGDAVWLSPGMEAADLKTAWSGTIFGVLLNTGGWIFSSITPDGNVMTAGVDLGLEAAEGGCMTWTTSDFAFIYRDVVELRHMVAFVSDNGAVTAVAALESLSGDIAFENMDCVGIGENVALVWGTGETIGFGVWDRNGLAIGDQTLITLLGWYPARPDVVWTGSEIGVFYNKMGPDYTQVHLSRFSPSGASLGGEIPLSLDIADDMNGPVAAWDGSEYSFARGIGSYILFTRFSLCP